MTQSLAHTASEGTIADDNMRFFLQCYQADFRAFQHLEEMLHKSAIPADTDALLHGMSAISIQMERKLDQIRRWGGLLFAFEGSAAHEGVAA